MFFPYFDSLWYHFQWMVDEEELRVIHYTLGPLKPWDWWTSWLVKPVDVWQVYHFLSHSIVINLVFCLLFLSACHLYFLLIFYNASPKVVTFLLSKCPRYLFLFISLLFYLLTSIFLYMHFWVGGISSQVMFLL